MTTTILPANVADNTNLATLSFSLVSNSKQYLDAFIKDADVVDRTKASYLRSIGQFFAYATESKINVLDRRSILSYKDYLVNTKKLTILTAKNYMATLFLFFKWADANGVYPNICNGVKNVKANNDHRKQHLTKQSCRSLLTSMTEEDYKGNSLRDYAMVNLMLMTGLRVNEVAQANIEDIKMIGDVRVLYVLGKGHQSKDDAFVPLSEKAYAPIAAYLKQRAAYKTTDALFISDSNHHRSIDGEMTNRLTAGSISRIVKTNLRNIGIDDRAYTAHSLRHTTGVAIIANGGRVEDAQLLLRHEQITTTQIYLKSYEREQRLKSICTTLLDEAF